MTFVDCVIFFISARKAPLSSDCVSRSVASVPLRKNFIFEFFFVEPETVTFQSAIVIPLSGLVIVMSPVAFPPVSHPPAHTVTSTEPSS